MQVKDLVHRFLLDSGFTRASLLTDPEALYLNGDQSQSYGPAFLVIDPDTAEPLAVIDVSSNERGDLAAQRAERAARYARKVDGTSLQAYVITVENDSAEAVRFVKVWPNKQYQNISTQMFPDLETLQVARRVSQNALEKRGSVDIVSDEDMPELAVDEKKFRPWVPYCLAFSLLVIAGVDWFISRTTGNSLFATPQLVLVITAAVLLALPHLVPQANLVSKGKK